MPGAGAPAAPATAPVLVRRPENAEPFAFWDQYLKSHPVTQDEMLPNVVFLQKAERFRELRAAITAYLKYRDRDPDPFWYETLALATIADKGPEKDVKDAFGYAADQAIKRGTPIDLTRVADELFIHNFPERVPELLERAWTVDPSTPRPLIMAFNCASKTKDVTLMGKAIDQFYSLGWPGGDETLRAEARQTVEALAKSLKSDGREAEAQKLLEQLPMAEARDLFVRLTWTGDAWIDLVVEEPLGATAKYLTPRTVFGGAIVKSGRGKHPESVYTCPQGFDGDYKIRVEMTFNDEKNPAREATLEIITHEGTPQEKVEQRTIWLAKPKPVTVTLKGGRRKHVLPFQAPPVEAPAAPLDGKAQEKSGKAPAAPDPAKVLEPGKPKSNRSGAPIQSEGATRPNARPATRP